jgi:YidC/Oxa1 family membrane protein insertase
MNIRSALAAPFRLSPIDLLAAIAVAFIAFGLVVGPVMGQDASPSAEPAATLAASPDASPSAEPAATLAATPEPSPPAAATSEAQVSPEPQSSVEPAATPGTSASLSPAPSAAAGTDPCEPAPTQDPNVSPDPDATDAPPANLCPAQPTSNPLDLLAWLFTPIFQIIFIGLAELYDITGDIGIAIILLTIIIRILLIPVFRAQIVSQRRMQMLQPELRAIQTKYKGDRQKISEEQMKLYRDRGVNPASGCLPAVLQMFLLLPMYQVFMRGLSAPDISSMLSVSIPFTGTEVQVVTVTCYDPTNPYAPCIDPNIPWLAWLPKVDNGLMIPGYPGGLPANEPEIFIMVFAGLGLGLSLLATFSALMQLIQSRMMMNRNIAPGDTTATTTNRMMLLLPAFSLIYGAILPAGLFIYWITTSVFSVIQQFLINGFGGLFPLFAKDFQAPFPVSMPAPKPADPAGDKGKTTTTTKRSTKESAAGTIRPVRRRSRRRGRRR